MLVLALCDHFLLRRDVLSTVQPIHEQELLAGVKTTGAP